LTRREEAPSGGSEGTTVRLEKGECTFSRTHRKISDTLARIQADIGASQLTKALEDLQRTNKEITQRLEEMEDCCF
jgi:hypothetical protein